MRDALLIIRNTTNGDDLSQLVCTAAAAMVTSLTKSRKEWVRNKMWWISRNKSWPGEEFKHCVYVLWSTFNLILREISVHIEKAQTNLNPEPTPPHLQLGPLSSWNYIFSRQRFVWCFHTTCMPDLQLIMCNCCKVV